VIGKVYKEMERNLCRIVLGGKLLSVRLFRPISHHHHDISNTIFRLQAVWDPFGVSRILDHGRVASYATSGGMALSS
jgi:hypothetical protein